MQLGPMVRAGVHVRVSIKVRVSIRQTVRKIDFGPGLSKYHAAVPHELATPGSNTDGIDPDSCSNVLIEDYYYCAGARTHSLIHSPCTPIDIHKTYMHTQNNDAYTHTKPYTKYMHTFDRHFLHHQ